MDVMLHNHRAKHMCDLPDGLGELCADMSREVIRSQPKNIYDFIASYLDTLLITRENAKVAMKVVQNVMIKSEKIVEILSGTGLRLEEMAAAAPRLQKAFRAYLEAVAGQRKECGCDDYSDNIDEEYEISICRILKETGATYDEAYCAAIKIQALFRGHYTRMSLAEKRGEVQWQRAAVNTVEILRKAGVSRNEASRAAVTIQAAYRGYYTRKNLDLRQRRKEEEAFKLTDERMESSTWVKLKLEDLGLAIEKANEAAMTIQIAYRAYRARKHPFSVLASQLSSTNSQHPQEGGESPADVAKSTSKESVRKHEKQHKDSSDGDDDDIDPDALKFTTAMSDHSANSSEQSAKSKQKDEHHKDTGSKKGDVDDGKIKFAYFDVPEEDANPEHDADEESQRDEAD